MTYAKTIHPTPRQRLGSQPVLLTFVAPEDANMYAVSIVMCDVYKCRLSAVLVANRIPAGYLSLVLSMRDFDRVFDWFW